MSGAWPCEFPSAQTVKLKVSTGSGSGSGSGFAGGYGGVPSSKVVVARSELTPSEVQDLGDIIPQILEVKNKANVPLTIHVQIEFGDGQTPPNKEAVQELNQLLSNVNEGLKLGQ